MNSNKSGNTPFSMTFLSIDFWLLFADFSMDSNPVHKIVYPSDLNFSTEKLLGHYYHFLGT